MVRSHLQHTEYKVLDDSNVVAYGSLIEVFMQLN